MNDQLGILDSIQKEEVKQDCIFYSNTANHTPDIQNDKQEQLEDKMEIEKDNFNEQENENLINENKKSKNVQKKRKQGEVDQTYVVTGKRERKPVPQYKEIPIEIPKKIVEKKKPEKYQKSEEMNAISTKIANWITIQKELQSLGYPSIQLQKEKLDQLLENYDQKDEAGKDYDIKLLIRIIAENLQVSDRDKISEEIQNQILNLLQQKNYQLNWTDQKWQEQIRSFIKIEQKSQINAELIKDVPLFNYEKLQQLTDNTVPDYIKECNHKITYIIIKANSPDDLKKFYDINELKNIRLIKDYLQNLSDKIQELQKIETKIQNIKKQEDEQTIINQFETLECNIITVKNIPIKYLKKTEIKIKPQKQQKEQKEQKESKIISAPQNLEQIEQELLNGEVNQENGQNQNSTEKKQNKKQEKKQQKQEKKQQKTINNSNGITLDHFKKKKFEIDPLPEKQQKNEPIISEATPEKDNIDQQQISNLTPNEQQQQQQQQQQIQEATAIQTIKQPQSSNSKPQVQSKNLMSFFSKKSQQETKKNNEIPPMKQLPPERKEQLDNLIEKLGNMNLNNSNDTLNTNISLMQLQLEDDESQKQQAKALQNKVRKIHLFIHDSMKEYNGHLFRHQSNVIKPRKPLNQDVDQLHYSECSEDEVEELLAQSLSKANDSDEESSEEEEQGDSFLVDDNHLSNDEVDDPEEILNNQMIANNQQNINGLTYFKIQQLEPEYFLQFKAIYIVNQSQEQQQQNQQTLLNPQLGITQKTVQIPKGKISFKNNQKKQKKKKPAQLINGQTQLQILPQENISNQDVQKQLVLNINNPTNIIITQEIENNGILDKQNCKINTEMEIEKTK